MSPVLAIDDYDYYYYDNVGAGATSDPSANSMGDDECVVDVGALVRTQHRVKVWWGDLLATQHSLSQIRTVIDNLLCFCPQGKVCAVDLRTILIENFHFDGLGAGVFINIGKKK